MLKAAFVLATCASLAPPPRSTTNQIRRHSTLLDEKERNRRRRVQRARERAIDALGGGVEGQAALDAFKKQLGRVVHGKVDADAFVSDVLSPGYFGEDGYGVSDRPEALSEEETALITDDTEEDEDSKLMPPVVELLRTLPDERAALREDLLRVLSARGVRVRMDME